MRIVVSVCLVGAAVVAVQAIGVALFLVSGVYNMGADDHHTASVAALIEVLRERAINRHARDIPVPVDLADSKRIAPGRQGLRQAVRRLSSGPGRRALAAAGRALSAPSQPGAGRHQ